jgi:hypothetical protein
VSCHDKRRARVYACLKRNKFARRQFFNRAVNCRRTEMRVLNRIAVAGEMLERRHNPAVKKPFGECHDHAGGRIRVPRERSVADDRVCRIGENVRNGREIYVKPKRL